MARKKRIQTVKISVKLTLPDEQALRSAAATLDRDPNWLLGKLCHLAVGTIGLSTDIRCWLRGDSAWDAGLSGDQKALMTIENDEPAVVRAPARKTVAQDPPALEEIAAYIKEKGYGFTAEEFFDHYCSNGWRQASGLPLLDWKLACRNPFQRNWLERHGGAAAAAAVSDWGVGRPAELDTPVDDRTATLPLEDAEPEQDGYLEDPGRRIPARGIVRV